ncbi:MAG: histidine phosphatase family protein [Lachnospiraceae bacterium]|nr:histidine phosphatase family protein [Candidatus Merdinaster equi]
MKLYIIRHGETDWNKEKRLQGQSDIPLNDYGRELARITGKALKDVHFDYVFSSPLSRAYETAELLTEGRGIEIKTDERIKEICFGEDEGIPAFERRETFPLFFEDPENYEPAKGGESYVELCKRTRDFIEEVIIPLSKQQPNATVLISGHGAMNRSLMIYLKHQGIGQMWEGIFQKNCCVNIFEINGYDFKLLQDGKIYYEEKEDAISGNVYVIGDAIRNGDK